MPLTPIPPLLLVAATLAGAAAMIAWRMRETSRPVSVGRILGPPLGMSTGFAMFLAPATRVPWTWAAAALLLGALVFAIPLIRTSRLVRRGDTVLVERSKAFLWILLALVALRFGLRAWIERHVTQLQTGGLFFLLAWGMVVRWRVGMLRTFLRLTRSGAPGAAPGVDAA